MSGLAGDLAGAADREEREREVAELRQALQRTQRKLARSKAKTADLIEAVYQAAHDAAVTLGTPPKIPTPKKDRRKGGEAALVHLTDLQYGKITDSYSMAVCERRVSQFADKIERITEIQRADHPVDECHVMLGGDMVEGRGNIFPGQIHEIEAFLYEQLFGVARLQEAFVRRMLAIFRSVVVWEESGNHGRLGKKGEDAPGDNVDRMGYRIARERIEPHARLRWVPQESWHRIVSIGNYRAMLAHGDEIKGFGGNVPAYGILRKCNAWASGVVKPDDERRARAGASAFDDVYLGHFHQEMTLQLANGGRVFVTPSTESDSVYAQEFVAASGRSGQRLHYIDPDKGRVSAQYLVWLD